MKNTHKQLISIVLSISLVYTSVGLSFAQEYLAMPGESELILLNPETDLTVKKEDNVKKNNDSVYFGEHTEERKLYEARLETLRKVWPHFRKNVRLFLTSAFNSEKIVQLFFGLTNGYIVEGDAKFENSRESFEWMEDILMGILAWYYRIIRWLPVRTRRKLAMYGLAGESGIDFIYSQKGKIALVKKFLSQKIIKKNHDIVIKPWKDKEGFKYTIVYSKHQLKTHIREIQNVLSSDINLREAWEKRYGKVAESDDPEKWINAMEDFYDLGDLFSNMYPQDFAAFVSYYNGFGRRMESTTIHNFCCAMFGKNAPHNIKRLKIRNSYMNHAWLTISTFEHTFSGFNSKPSQKQQEIFDKTIDFVNKVIALEKVAAKMEKYMFSIQYEHLGLFEDGYSAPGEKEKKRWAVEMAKELREAFEGVRPFISDDKIGEGLDIMIKNLLGCLGEISGIVEGLKKYLLEYMKHLPASDYAAALFDMERAIVRYNAYDAFVVKLYSIIAHQISLYNFNVYQNDDLLDEYKKNLKHYSAEKKTDMEKRIKESSEWLTEWWQEIKDLKEKRRQCKKERKEFMKLILASTEKLVSISQKIGMPTDMDWSNYVGQITYNKRTGAVYQIAEDDIAGNRDEHPPYLQFGRTLVDTVGVDMGDIVGSRIDLVPIYQWPQDVAGFVRLFPKGPFKAEKIIPLTLINRSL